MATNFDPDQLTTWGERIFNDANGQSVTNAWGATVSSSGSSIAARNAGYNGVVSSGASTTFGFLGSWNGSNGIPSAVTCTAT
jgi:hypothetical protein